MNNARTLSLGSARAAIASNNSSTEKSSALPATASRDARISSDDVRVLLRFENPHSGAVHYDGRELSSLDITAVRRQIGMVTRTAEC